MTCLHVYKIWALGMALLCNSKCVMSLMFQMTVSNFIGKLAVIPGRRDKCDHRMMEYLLGKFTVHQ